MNLARIVLLVLLALLLATTGGGKLAGLASSNAIRDSLHVPASRWKAIGVAEIGLVIVLIAGIWLPVTGIAAALGVVVLMIGAVLTRRAAGGHEQRSGILVDVLVLVAALAAAVLGFMLL
jgi:hypothetical protein